MYVSEQEVNDVVDHWRMQASPDYVDLFKMEPSAPPSSKDLLYSQAVALVMRERKASTSFIQRHLQVGYNQAARLIDRMELEGVVSKSNHVGYREVLAKPNHFG